ncbi:Hypothetical predicted protein [Pelobates cultripes]|uniref:Uncharacterized protein n=1 Tax=Pelobates cultripes TaxID=61616 RepID=A0AAD1SZT7_PELCU|nr:Hypothetical predicted protein [Pelobates cultripes]
MLLSVHISEYAKLYQASTDNANNATNCRVHAAELHAGSSSPWDLRSPPPLTFETPEAGFWLNTEHWGRNTCSVRTPCILSSLKP